MPHVWERPTGPVEDPWAWLADRDDPDTVAYLEAENVYADAWLEEHADLVDAIFDEIKARTQETDQSVPSRKGPWWFVSRTVEGLSYAIHCRGSSPETATEQVLLDENERARDQTFFEVGAFDVSEDHRLLAWSADLNGHEVFTLRVRDLDAGVDLPDVIEGTYYGTAWSADGRHLFYTVPDHAMRPHQVWRHELGTSQSDDVLIHQEDDERFNVDLGLTRSGEWIVITNECTTSTDVLVLRADDALGAPKLVAAPAAGRRVPARPLGRPVRHPHQPRRAGLQGRDCSVRRPPASSSGATWWPTRPAGGSPRSRPSPGTWSSTSGRRPASSSTSSAPTATSACSPSTSPSTRSASA